ncbi:MAG: uncharacterized protein A8A55_1972 [Amphiamblys sp. WSBS2006]|nr:MAG: uncharacterized protein A8A55_1972 [Amphiamblys sp. WSBS2006]
MTQDFSAREITSFLERNRLEAVKDGIWCFRCGYYIENKTAEQHSRNDRKNDKKNTKKNTALPEILYVKGRPGIWGAALLFAEKKQEEEQTCNTDDRISCLEQENFLLRERISALEAALVSPPETPVEEDATPREETPVEEDATPREETPRSAARTKKKAAPSETASLYSYIHVVEKKKPVTVSNTADTIATDETTPDIAVVSQSA